MVEKKTVSKKKHLQLFYVSYFTYVLSAINRIFEQTKRASQCKAKTRENLKEKIFPSRLWKVISNSQKLVFERSQSNIFRKIQSRNNLLNSIKSTLAVIIGSFKRHDFLVTHFSANFRAGLLFDISKLWYLFHWNYYFFDFVCVFEQSCVVEWNIWWLLLCACLRLMNGMQLQIFNFTLILSLKVNCYIFSELVILCSLLCRSFKKNKGHNHYELVVFFVTTIKHDVGLFYSNTCSGKKVLVSISKRIASISACWSSFQNTWQGFKVKIQEIRVGRTRIKFFRNFHRLHLATSFNSKTARLPISRESEVLHEKSLFFVGGVRDSCQVLEYLLEAC